MKQTMEAKKYLVSFLAVVAILCVISSVSADNLGDVTRVDVDGATVYGTSLTDLSVQAGDTVKIDVWFTANQYDQDVVINAEIKGHGSNVNVDSNPFNVEENKSYKRTLTLVVPNELKDDLSNDFSLKIKVEGKDHESDEISIPLYIQRTPYDVAIKSVSVDQTLKAGETFPVQIVLKNIGYNDLNDLYVTAKIATLGIQKSGYFGDLVAIEGCVKGDSAVNNYGLDINRKCVEDKTDSVSATLNLELPYDVQAGKYNLELTVQNEDTTSTQNVEVVVQNDFDSTVFKSGNSIWLVNPTDSVIGYRLVAESPATLSDTIVFVPAGGSKTVTVDPNTSGEYNFKVNVFSLKGETLNSIEFSGNTSGKTETESATKTSPIVILTVVLAIIFIVLLIVLIVLIGKKPEKSGEFGESYY
ncbi:MAG: hypothetical protein AABW63_01225 [Nanoarchaeota archaeon]